MWVVRNALTSKASIDEMLDAASHMMITDLLVQVRGRGDAYYTSSIVPRAERLTSDFDPLQYLLESPRSKKFRVHAWLNVFYIWSADNLPTSKAHLLYSRNEWSAVSATGKSMVSEGAPALRRRHLEGVFLSPASDGYRNRFARIVTELLRNYKLDGIHLDYIRYPGREYDYSVMMRAKFRLAYHVDPLERIAGSPEEEAWFRRTWNKFRSRQLNDFVWTIRDSISGINKDCVLSAAVFADIHRASDDLFQDWTAWLQVGVLDWAVIMNYANRDNTYQSNLKNIQNAIGQKSMKESVVVGTAAHNQSAADFSRKMRILRKYKVRGVSIFSYQAIKGQAQYVSTIREAKP